jgi:signal transduction histidine kinase
MHRLRGLRAQMLIWTISPLIAVLMLVSLGSITLHQNSMRDMVARRDAQLVHLAAERLDSGLHQPALTLQTLLDQVQSSGPQAALRADARTLTGFDGGVALYDAQSRPLTSLPPAVVAAGPQVQEIVAAAQLHPGQPAYRLTGEAGGQYMLVSVANDRPGPVAVGALSAGAMDLPGLFSGLQGERRAQAYLVDGSGRVIYQTNAGELGRDLSGHGGVPEALRGQSGWTFVRMPGQEEHVVGYAPVAAGGWGLMLEEPWGDVVVPALRYTLLAPLIVLLAAIASLVALHFVLRRVIGPLQVLGHSASRLAWGDFGAIEKPLQGIGEIQELQRTLQEMAAQIQRHQAGMQDYIAALTQTQEDERRRLARELHDETIQSLIAVSQRVKMLEFDWRACAGAQPTKEMLAAQDRIGEISGMLTQMLGEVRGLIRNLRPIYLEELGLMSALEMLAQGNDHNGTVTTFELAGEECRLTPEAEMAVYRIAQAAMSNAIRHASPSRIRLGLEFGEGGVTLTAEDNGRGFVPPEMPGDLAVQGHFGLVGMYERATRLSGHLSIRSTPGQGTKVVAFVPGRAAED